MKLRGTGSKPYQLKVSLVEVRHLCLGALFSIKVDILFDWLRRSAAVAAACSLNEFVCSCLFFFFFFFFFVLGCS